MFGVSSCLHRTPRETWIPLHGRNEDPYDYASDYSTEEFEPLAEELTDLATDRDAVYCLFNTDAMFDNARELQTIRR